MKNKKLLHLIIILPMLFLTKPSFSESNEHKNKVPDILTRSAIISHKAITSVMLAVTRAGDSLVVAGERGIILTSDDNGLNWKQASVPTSVNLTSLEFIDDKNGWATGHMGVILNTKDGGKTWTKQLDGIQAAQLAVKSVAGSGNEHAIKEANYLVSDGPDKPFFDINMQSNGYGIAVGAFNLAFMTDDAGKTWNYLSPNISNQLNRHLHKVDKIKEGYVIFGEQGLILYSDDNGRSFRQLDTPYEGTWFGMLETQDGAWLAYGLKGNAFISRDKGTSWSKIDVNSTISISAATQLKDGTIILATQSGEIITGNSQNNSYKVTKQLAGFPITSLIEAESGDIIVTGLRGLITINKNEIKSQ